jgi:hypothetical protein
VYRPTSQDEPGRARTSQDPGQAYKPGHTSRVVLLSAALEGSDEDDASGRRMQCTEVSDRVTGCKNVAFLTVYRSSRANNLKHRDPIFDRPRQPAIALAGQLYSGYHPSALPPASLPFDSLESFDSLGSLDFPSARSSLWPSSRAVRNRRRGFAGPLTKVTWFRAGTGPIGAPAQAVV